MHDFNRKVGSEILVEEGNDRFQIMAGVVFFRMARDRLRCRAHYLTRAPPTPSYASDTRLVTPAAARLNRNAGFELSRWCPCSHPKPLIFQFQDAASSRGTGIRNRTCAEVALSQSQKAFILKVLGVRFRCFARYTTRAVLSSIIAESQVNER